MDKDRIEEILSNYNALKKRVEILKDDLESIEAYGVSALSFAQVNGGNTNKIARPTEEQAMDISEIKESIEQEIDLLEQQIKIIDKALEGLNNLEKEVVRQKIIKNEPYFRICGNLKISESHAKRVKKNGIESIADILTPNYLKKGAKL